MICFILAGGSSDRLWPLSRRKFPKQFMTIRKGYSIFQETILRNIPFCDRFVIITNKRYEKVVGGQLRAFQGVDYSIVLEESILKTAPSVITCALREEPEEELLIVSTDNLVDGEYNLCITEVKKIVRKNKIAMVVTDAQNNKSDYHYINELNGKIRFSLKRSKNSYWDCGIIGTKVSVLLASVEPHILEQYRKIKLVENVVTKKQTLGIAPASLSRVLNKKQIQLIKATFEWHRITDITTYLNYLQQNETHNIITHNSKSVDIVNTISDQLVVANGVKNIVVVNTRDVIYVSAKGCEAGIKNIMEANYHFQHKYFEEPPERYEEWGIEEDVTFFGNCIIRKVIIYPNKTYETHTQKNETCNYVITKGHVQFISKDIKREYSICENFTCGPNSVYSIKNKSNEDIILACTRTLLREKCDQSENYFECFEKLSPSFRDSIWGGTRIGAIFGKSTDLTRIAESWELSAYPGHESKIACGQYKGLKLTEYFEKIGKENLGWKCGTYKNFPLMIKFIDAKENLSIQVHPSDEYAFPVEGDYGKNEMWYILTSEPESYIYLGFNKDVSKEEVRNRIADGAIVDILNKIPVKAGETYFLGAGTVHAIGAGCLVCEVQQSSNVTYRLYDFDRKDANGQTRALQIDKALDVTDCKKTDIFDIPEFCKEVGLGYTKQILGQCKYFKATKYCVDGYMELPFVESSFMAVVILEGTCTIGNGKHSMNSIAGETWFFGCYENLIVSGNCTALVVNI